MIKYFPKQHKSFTDAILDDFFSKSGRTALSWNNVLSKMFPACERFIMAFPQVDPNKLMQIAPGVSMVIQGVRKEIE